MTDLLKIKESDKIFEIGTGSGWQAAVLEEIAKAVYSKINGFASVVGAVLASLLAIHLGFAAVILLAVLIYGWAALALRGFA